MKSIHLLCQPFYVLASPRVFRDRRVSIQLFFKFLTSCLVSVLITMSLFASSDFGGFERGNPLVAREVPIGFSSYSHSSSFNTESFFVEGDAVKEITTPLVRIVKPTTELYLLRREPVPQALLPRW